MKKNKGFTLVELLAVIVILAIVALIVVPVVMNVIKDARKKSAIESFRGYMDAVEKTIIRDSMKTTSELPNKDSNGCYSLRELDSKVKVKGDHPEIEETDKLCVENGKIKSISEVEMNEYALEYKDGDILLNGQAIEDKTIPEITIGEVTATKNSITIPYEVQSGKSGVTVTCEYGTSESYGNNGTIEDNKCILSNLEAETKYYFRLNSKTGKNKTSNQASSKETLCEYDINQQFNFSYTGNVQEFNPKCTGKYKLEVWGAQGGSMNSSTSGGLGGYSYGNYNATANSTLYVVVGGKGNYHTDCTYCSKPGGYNGGGGSTNYGHQGGAGGGATHIAIKTGLLSSLASYKSDILIVAGGGGGGIISGGASDANGSGGVGGGYQGGTGQGVNGAVTPGNQTSGYSFGQGATGSNGGTYYCEGGGGGGLYGGYGGSSTCWSSGGGGGSGYLNTSKLISGTYRMYCYTSNSSLGYATGCPTNATYYTYGTTNYSSTPTSNYAKQGNGYARITYLGK